jgi:hypothetical protein
MLVRHSAHLLVQQQQQQQQQKLTSQSVPARIAIMMGGAFCFSFGCVFSPCYHMPLPVPSKFLEDHQAQSRITAEVDVLLCPKVRSMAIRRLLQFILYLTSVTRHTSHVTRHTSHVTRHTSHVTRHLSHVTRHTSHVTRHTSHVTRNSLIDAPVQSHAESVRTCLIASSSSILMLDRSRRSQVALPPPLHHRT